MLKALAVLVLPGLLAGGFAVGTGTLVGRDPPPSQWVVWGGDAFSTPDEIASWLRARGFTYETWAERHPSAAARLEGREPPQPAPEAVAAEAAPASGDETAPRRETAPAPTPAAPPPGTSSGGQEAMLLVAILGFAAALVTLASFPVILLQRLRVPTLLREHRPELAAVGVSLAIGLGAASLF